MTKEINKYQNIKLKKMGLERAEKGENIRRIEKKIKKGNVINCQQEEDSLAKTLEKKKE